MIGLMVVGVIVGYIFLAKFIVTKVYEKTQSLKKKYIALAIVILIPTWDAILGLPIYMYLCKYHAGVKIYQTVDGVEGFYIGEDYGTYSKIPPLPYHGYRFIDYKKRKNSKEPYKYYRVSWVDANTTSECIQIGNGSDEYDLNLYKIGKCIVKEEITESEVSQWEIKNGTWDTFRTLIPLISIKKGILIEIKERVTQKGYGEIVDYRWKAGWITGYIFTGWSVDFEPQGVHSTYDPYKNSEMEDAFIKNILKPKGDK